ncbi:MAG: hypothetical protein OEV93_02170 [Candidatus Moranbacteria bacterium]|nr:hypothetical protein [Candidatus Moranbacteria bacterium]
MNWNIKNTKGASLIEVVISMSIILIFVSVSVPAYRAVREKNNVNIAVTSLVKSLRYAQSMSLANRGDGDWGVRVRTGEVIVFKGSNYGNRDSDFDLILEVSSNVDFSGETEVVFSKAFGIPDVTGSISVSNGVSSEDIVINEKGTVDY